MSILFVNRLTIVDFSYLHAERGLLGESWLLDVELEGGLDEQGMVLDFGEVKRQVKRHVDAAYDHKLIVPIGNAGCIVDATNDEIKVRFTTTTGTSVFHRSPPEALCLLEADEVRPDTVAAAMIQSLRRQLPANVARIAIHLYPEATSGAFFHYSHGLKHHGGNCQRIAHGHRSRIQILRDGDRDPLLEAEWAERWRDIYIGTREDLMGEEAIDGLQHHRYAYTSSQGQFELSVPAARSYLIDTESTVENLAQHIADRLKSRFPQHAFEVRAFEGVDKGALGKA